jgi:site-specific DNA-methyltransferase (adenine-specific)
VGEVVKIGDATLYHGDCLDILPTLPKVDAVVTDPPYGIGFAAQPTMYQRKNGHESQAWDSQPADIALTLKAGNVVAIWGGNYYALPPSRGWLAWLKPDSPPSMADLELCWTSLDTNARAFHKSVKSAALEKDMVRGFHPTQKPVALMEWTIERVRASGLALVSAAGVVIDPYMGSGSTGVACTNLGRKFIGIEIERKYFDIACERIDNAYRQQRMFA